MKNSVKSYLSLKDRAGGSILITAIWILVVLSVFSSGLYRIVSARIRMSQAVESRKVSYFLAKSALIDAAGVLFKDNRPAYDTIFSLSEERSKTIGSGELIYTVEDEESRIDINQNSVEVIARLPGLTGESANAIVNSRLRPFTAKEELLLVEGISEEVFDGFKDFICLYSGGKVNINTAPREVLTALGIDPALVNIIVDFRRGQDGKEGTADDEIFESTAEILDRLRSRVSFMAAQEQTLAGVTNLLTAASQYFRVKIKTYVFNKQAMYYEAVIGKSSVLEWRER
ncbi:MAG: helix-hairpin-helix domain-containing protein [Candidatus Omnitrophota bacterium]